MPKNVQIRWVLNPEGVFVHGRDLEQMILLEGGSSRLLRKYREFLAAGEKKQEEVRQQETQSAPVLAPESLPVETKLRRVYRGIYDFFHPDQHKVEKEE